MPRRYPWTSWPASRLLPMRLRDLNLRIEGTWLEECVDQLGDELTGRGITLHPTVWLSDEIGRAHV